MRILQVVRTMNIGGLENFVKNMLQYLSEKCDCGCLICDEKKSDHEDDLVKAGIKIYHIPEPDKTKINLYNNLQAFFETHREYDIVHCHMAGTNGIVAKAAKDAGINKVVCHSHGVALQQDEALSMKLYMLCMRKLMQRHADAFIACSKAAGNYLYGQESFGEVGKVVPNGIEINRYRYSDDERNSCREELGFKESDFVIGHTGSLNGVKNQELILDIAGILKEKRIPVRVLLVGGGNREQDLKKQAKDLKIEEDVIITGKQMGVTKFLDAMDVFMFPSRSEGFGLSLLEAEANGLPCVVSDKIQPEVKVLNSVLSVSLNEPIQCWIEAVEKAKVLGRSKMANEILDEKGMSEAACYETVWKIYNEVLSK